MDLADGVYNEYYPSGAISVTGECMSKGRSPAPGKLSMKMASNFKEILNFKVMSKAFYKHHLPITSRYCHMLRGQLNESA
jgi:hypothetical protein